MADVRSTQGHRNAPPMAVAAAGAEFAYREYGPRGGVPLIALTHLGANLDSWDPRIVEGLAEERHVIAVGYRGVGGHSTGPVRESIEDMAEDMAAVIRALGYGRVDVFGLSMGGMVAQAIAVQAPELIDRLILAGSGPAGGPRLTDMTRITITTVLRAVITFNDPKALLFFTRTPAGKEARARVSRAVGGAHCRTRQASHPEGVPGAVGRGAPVGSAAARWSFPRHRPGAHRARRQRPHGAGGKRGRAHPAAAHRVGHDLPGFRPRRRLPKPPRVRRRRPGIPPPVTGTHQLHHAASPTRSKNHESVRRRKTKAHCRNRMFLSPQWGTGCAGAGAGRGPQHAR